MTSKENIVKDMRFCKELMDRLVKDAENMDDSPWNNKHTVIQGDIIRLRRELNQVRQELNWDYEEVEG